MTAREIEELFLVADKAIDDGNFAEGKKILEELIHEEPCYGKAHNHLGWIYKSKYNDYRTAENHFRTAIVFEPEYPHTYLNYAYLLREIERYTDQEEVLNDALKVPGTNKAAIFDEYGSMYELKGQYNEAIKAYKKAIELSLNDKGIEDYINNIKRCKLKKKLFYQMFTFFDTVKGWFSKKVQVAETKA